MNRRQAFDAWHHSDLSAIMFVIQNTPVWARRQREQRMFHRGQIILGNSIKDIAEKKSPRRFSWICSACPCHE